MIDPKQEARMEIDRIVGKIQAIRNDASLSKEQKTALCAECDVKIRELKKITGPRRIEGTADVGSDKSMLPQLENYVARVRASAEEQVRGALAQIEKIKQRQK